MDMTQGFLKVRIVAANIVFLQIITVIASSLALFQTAWQSLNHRRDCRGGKSIRLADLKKGVPPILFFEAAT